MRTKAHAIENKALRAFVLGYAACALWSSHDESDESGGDPMDSNYDLEDIADDTADAMIAECSAFYAANVAHIHCEGAPISCEDSSLTIYQAEAARAGHDFWLTRVGHGAGFWDGDWPEPAATALTEASKAAGERWLYVGDDGEIHQS